jgi:hypothetical protein
MASSLETVYEVYRLARPVNGSVSQADDKVAGAQKHTLSGLVKMRIIPVKEQGTGIIGGI